MDTMDTFCDFYFTYLFPVQKHYNRSEGGIRDFVSGKGKFKMSEIPE